jgi:hypothetical protein
LGQAVHASSITDAKNFGRKMDLGWAILLNSRGMVKITETR